MEKYSPCKNARYLVTHLCKYLHLLCTRHCVGASLVAQRLKCLPAMQETCVRSLGREDPWRRKQLPTLVFLPGEFHGQRSLKGDIPWARKELDMTERLTQTEVIKLT